MLVQEGGLFPVRRLVRDKLDRVFAHVGPLLGTQQDIINATFFLQRDGAQVRASLQDRNRFLQERESAEGPTRAHMVSPAATGSCHLDLAAGPAVTEAGLLDQDSC